MTAPADHSSDDRDLRLPGDRSLAASRLTWRATTSGGPGGQHANRTASRVELVVHIADLPLTPRETARLYDRLASRVTGAGDLVTASGDTRDQHRNRRTALRRMERLIADALHVDKRRIPTRESWGTKLRRRASKQHHSQLKQTRRRTWDED